MYIFIKKVLATVLHLSDEKRVIALAFIVDSTTQCPSSWGKEITRPLALSFKGFGVIVGMLTNISAKKILANFHFTKPPSNLSTGDGQTLKDKFVDSN